MHLIVASKLAFLFAHTLETINLTQHEPLGKVWRLLKFEFVIGHVILCASEKK